MVSQDDLPLSAYRGAALAITNGNPGGYKALYSRRADVTLANPFGPPALGWDEVSATLDRAASHYQDGQELAVENISTIIGSDLAYIVEIERFRARVDGAAQLADVAIRVTTVFRREEETWKVVHRHADPITTPRAAASVVQP